MEDAGFALLLDAEEDCCCCLFEESVVVDEEEDALPARRSAHVRGRLGVVLLPA